MEIGSGVSSRKRRSGGVIASRLRASAKNGKTASGGASRTCSRSRTWTFMLWTRMTDLRSAPAPGLRDGDHVRGDGPLVVVYADFTCPRCAVAHARLQALPVRRVFRHLALKAKHPRAIPVARAAEAAALQDAFWPFHDALYADQGRQDDPHLWALADRLGLDVDRFERDRRSDE